MYGKKPFAFGLRMCSQSQYDRGSLAFLAGGQRLLGNRVEAEAGRKHESLLRSGNRDVDFPLVVTIVDRTERRDRVHDQQRRMAGAVHRAPQVANPARDAGRRLVVHGDDRLDRVTLVRRQPLLELFGRAAATPGARHVIDLEPQLLRLVPPGDMREPARFQDQHPVSRRQRVDHRRFACPGARRRVHQDGPGRLERRTQALEHLQAEPGEVGAPMVDRRVVHGPENPVGNVGGAGNLQKVPPGTSGHCMLSVCVRFGREDIPDWPPGSRLAAPVTSTGYGARR